MKCSIYGSESICSEGSKKKRTKKIVRECINLSYMRTKATAKSQQCVKNVCQGKGASSCTISKMLAGKQIFPGRKIVFTDLVIFSLKSLQAFA